MQARCTASPWSAPARPASPLPWPRCAPAAGDDESLFVNAIAFDAGACAALLALNDGDSVSLAGTLTPKVWTDKDGNARPALDMVAHQVLSAYHVTRKRAAMQEGQAQAAGQHRHQHPQNEAWQARAPRRPAPDDRVLDF